MGNFFHVLRVSILAVIFLASCGIASAHTTVNESVPADGAVYETLPDTLQLTFGQPVRLASVDIREVGGEAVDMVFERQTSADRTFSVPAPSLSEGRYVLRWTAMAKDGHVMKGEIAFAIKRAAD